MIVTKEKLVAAVALVVAFSTLSHVRFSKPPGDVVEVPSEADAKKLPSRGEGAAPTLRPDKPYGDGAPRDPFAAATAWSDAQPARLGSPPAAPIGRAWPAGSFPQGPPPPPVKLAQDPKPDPNEGDPNAPKGE